MNEQDRLRSAASLAKSYMQRVSGDGSVLESLASGQWKADSERHADALADLLEALAEQVRYARVQVGYMTNGGSSIAPKPAPDWPEVAEAMSDGLPLNRKERYYTGTVLPMIVASDGLMHLHRLTSLVGIEIEHSAHGMLETNPAIQFFTEYNFAESRKTPGDHQRFPHPPNADSPDVVIVGQDWLLAIEAKMFHRPPAMDLNHQMGRQRELVDYWAGHLHLDPARVKHVLLVPEQLSVTGVSAQKGGTHQVLTWQAVEDAYRLVAPTYWLDVLRVALQRYNDLKSPEKTFRLNREEMLAGAEIVRRYQDATLTYDHVGRQYGLHGAKFADDIATGDWRVQEYEVRVGPLPGNRNWFTIAEFIDRVLAH